MRATHAKQSHEPGLRSAAARASGRLRIGGPPPQLHPRCRRDRAHPVGGQPADPGARGQPRCRALSPPAPRARAHRGRPQLPAGYCHRARRSRRGDASAQAPCRAQDRRRHHHAWLCRAVADPAPVDLRGGEPGRRCPHLGQLRAGPAGARRRRHRGALSAGGSGAGERGCPVRRDGLSGLQPEAAPWRAQRIARPGRSRQADAAAYGARRQEPVAGLGSLAGGHAARRPEAGGGAAFLVVRPADPGGDLGTGRRPRQAAADRSADQVEEAGRAVCRRSGVAARLLHDRRGACRAKAEAQAFAAWLTASARSPDSTRRRGRALA